VHKTFKEFTLGAPSTPQNASLSEAYAPYEPSPRIVSYEPPSCMSWLGTTIIQDEHIGDLDVMEDLAEHDQIDQKDLGFMIDEDESQETHDESFGLFEYSSQNIEDDPYDSDIEVEMPREALEILGKMLGLDYNKTHVEDIGDLDTRNDEVENLSPPSTPQVLPSFEAHTPPVTYPEEVEETLGIPIEVEPLNQTQLEDIGLNTYNDNLTLSYREVPSFDEPKPQPKSLPNLLSLDENLGIEIGSDPPTKPYIPGSLRIKVVDSKPCVVEANIGVNHELTYLHHPFMSDYKKHYGFKPGLLGQDGFQTRSLSKLIENDPFLGENFNSPIDQSELGKVMMIGAHPF
jgi:hypothetical protein